MKERRRIVKIESTLNFLNIAIIAATVLAVIGFFALIKLLTAPRDSLVWLIDLVILQIGFIAAVFTFLFTIFYMAHRVLGPIPRIERILDKVIAGDYTQRMSVREKDVLFTFVAKVNKLIELLSSKAKG